MQIELSSGGYVRQIALGGIKSTLSTRTCGRKPSQESTFSGMTQMPSWIASSCWHLGHTHPNAHGSNQEAKEPLAPFQSFRPPDQVQLNSGQSACHHLSHLGCPQPPSNVPLGSVICSRTRSGGMPKLSDNLRVESYS